MLDFKFYITSHIDLTHTSQSPLYALDLLLQQQALYISRSNQRVYTTVSLEAYINIKRRGKGHNTTTSKQASESQHKSYLSIYIYISTPPLFIHRISVYQSINLPVRVLFREPTQHTSDYITLFTPKRERERAFTIPQIFASKLPIQLSIQLYHAYPPLLTPLLIYSPHP